MGPDYVRPVTAIPSHFKEAPAGWSHAKPQDQIDRGSWWTLFHDTTLNQLENKVAVNNQNIVQAAAQFRQASALLLQSQASLFPAINTATSSIRQKSATLGSSAIGIPSTSRIANTFTLNLNTSWEPDLWGKIRRQVEADQAGASASFWQLAVMKLSMQATLAQTYFQLRAYDALQQSWTRTVAANQQLLVLTHSRYRAGIATLSDIANSESQLKLGEAAAADNQLARAQTEHALAALIGLSPAHFSVSPRILSLPSIRIPGQIPATLLQRRPDIAAAERNVAQANADIGVAIAAFFPTITLSGEDGYTSNNIAHLFSLPTQLWSMGLQLSQNLIDGGQRLATTTAARANYDASVAQYRQTVLTALQEVEDNLVALRKLKQARAAEQQAWHDVAVSLQMVKTNLRAGTAAKIDVLTAELALETANRNLITVKNRQLVAAVNLIKALGGRW